MSLIKSISGIRGTIGGAPGQGLTPVDIVKFTCAYAQFIAQEHPEMPRRIVVGRDARLSGPMVEYLVCGALTGMGFDVVNIGPASTPTTELAVTWEGAAGGIIITASHNPLQWNALKLLDASGEFLTDAQGREVIRRADAGDFLSADVLDLGRVYHNDTYVRRHIDAVLALDLVDAKAIRDAHLRVAVDAVDSVGGVIVPQLLRALGVEEVVELNCIPTGRFSHTPEPIPENLTGISDLMATGVADVGFVVDPDVDRLAIVMEDGSMFVEEYTLVAVADYVLSRTPGATVSNLSSSRALSDVTRAHGCRYTASAVGEVNVVAQMKATGAVIGGEGNGGVIYPALHYGRDAMVGIALFLTLLARSGKTVSQLRRTYPPYAIAKTKLALTPDTDVDALLRAVKERYQKEPDAVINDVDGVKIDFPDSWVHLRRSNTEPIVRIYAEAPTMDRAEALAGQVRQTLSALNH